MMVTMLGFWCRNHYIGEFYKNLALTSKACHQHKLYPTYVTNIDITVNFLSLIYGQNGHNQRSSQGNNERSPRERFVRELALLLGSLVTMAKMSKSHLPNR